MVRRKRRVRLITISDQLPDFEGVLERRRPIGGHYLLRAPKVLRQVGDEVHTTTVDGHLEVPAERVLFVQVLGE
jgi:hypothetical protein